MAHGKFLLPLKEQFPSAGDQAVVELKREKLAAEKLMTNGMSFAGYGAPHPEMFRHEPENSDWGDSQHVGQFESD
jgi:hypothetical protein